MATTKDPLRGLAVASDDSDARRGELLRTQQLRQLAETSLLINSSLSLSFVLETLAAQARKIVGAHQCAITTTTGGNWALAVNVVSLSDKYAAWRGFDAPRDGTGIYALVARINIPMRLTQEELEAHPAWRGMGKEAEKHPPLRGWLAAPLIGRGSLNIGVIQLSDKLEGEFTEEDEFILVQLAQMASVAIENSRLYRQVEERLERHLAITDTVMASLGEGVCTLDLEGRIVSLNPAAAALLGWTQEELPHSDVHAHMHRESHARAAGTGDGAREGQREHSAAAGALCPLLEVLESGELRRHEGERFTRKDGSSFPVAWTAAPIVAEGRVVGATLVFRDVTERKRAEEALRESQRALSTLLSNLPGFAYRCRRDLERTMEFVSEGIADLTGHRAEE